MASPLLIGPHHHLDCTYLDKDSNVSGTLEEAIWIKARVKTQRSSAELSQKANQPQERAVHYLDDNLGHEADLTLAGSRATLAVVRWQPYDEFMIRRPAFPTME